MGWEEVADRLYALPPEQFIAARDEAAKAAPRGDAAKIRGLRRPTLAAWAVNLLVRSDRDQIAALLGLGEQLRRAHQDLDGSQLRELSGRQRQLVTALSQQTQRLATDAGRPVSESVLREVEATVQAALADADAADELATGRMTKALTPTAGFGPPVSATVHRLRPREPRSGTGGRAGRGSSTAPGRTASVTHLAERAEEQERAERERREALAAALDLEVELEHSARDSEQKSADSQDELADAEARRRRAEERVRELESELKEARAELTEARRGERNARVPARRAREAAERDRKRAEDAAADVDRLEAEEPRGRGGRTRR
ncbi:hypothetical protein [Streptomyces sp. NPDC048639]|uniref:hypothetical protein n=1 Tax=Streptomyces sp. NPDC048639 TaxID=3365581 RepID=UPI0037105CB1